MSPRLRRALGFVMASPLLRDAGVYTAAQLLAKATPFLLLPVMTRYLTPADYGVVAMFMLVATIVEPFIGLGLSGAVAVKFFDDEVDLPRYVSTGLTTVLTAALPVALLFILLRGPLSRWTEVPPGWLCVVAPYVVCRVTSAVVMTLWRVQRRPVAYGVFINVQSAAIILGSIALVVGQGRHADGRIEAEVLALAASGLLALYALWRRGSLARTTSREYRAHLLRFGVPLIPHALGAVLMIQTDRMMLTTFVSIDETGLYTTAFQLTLLIELATQSFNNAYTPWLYGKLKGADDAMRLRLVRTTYLHFAGVALFAAAVALVMPPLAERFLDPRYAGAAKYVPWLAAGFACNGMYYMVSNYVFYAERTRWLALVTASVAVLNIPVTYGLVRAQGAVGAAQASFVAMALLFLATWVLAARAVPMPWDTLWRRRKA